MGYIQESNLTFKLSPCSTGTRQEVQQAIQEGFLPKSALQAMHGNTRKGVKRSELIGKALGHLRLMKVIVNQPSNLVNVFVDLEVVLADFRTHRNELLGHLPRRLDFVNLNPRQTAGQKVQLKPEKSHGQLSKPAKAMERIRGKVFHLTADLSPFTNERLSNYIVSKRWAKKILDFGRSYDTFGKWETFDKYLLSKFYDSARASDFAGFSVSTNTFSVCCTPSGTLDGKSKKQELISMCSLKTKRGNNFAEAKRR